MQDETAHVGAQLIHFKKNCGWLVREAKNSGSNAHTILAHSESTNQIKLNGRESGQTHLLQRARRPLPPPQPSWPWSWNSLVPIDDRSNIIETVQKGTDYEVF
jgi:hypothetical protein